MSAMLTEPTTRPAGGLDLSAMKRLIRNGRWLLRSSWGTTGLGLTAGLALAVLVAAIILDLVLPAVLMATVPVGYLVPLTVAFRVTAATLVVVPALYVFAVGVVVPTLRRLRSADVARRIESQIPGMHNRLVACMDLAAGETKVPVSRAFHERLTREAAAKLEGYRTTRLVDTASVVKALGFAAVAALAFGALWLGFRDRLPVALTRLVSPTADIAPASGVKFVATPNADAKLLRGDDVTFGATFTEGEPQTVTAQLYSATEREPLLGAWAPAWMNPTWPKTRTVELPRDKGFRHTLTSSNLGAGFEKAFAFRVFAGGTWTPLQTVTLLERPEIKGVSTSLFYPEYLGYTEPTRGKAGVWDVAGPGGRMVDRENGQIEVVVETAGNVASGEVQLLRTAVVRTPVPPAERRDRVWFAHEMPAGSAPAGGTWAAGQPWAGRTAHTDPAQPGLHFHAFQADPKGFKLEPDDVLFAWVNVDGKARPEAIALQWQDETGNWDHAAFWGVEKMTAAKLGLGSGLRVGTAPEAGDWRLLSVPARSVGLEGRTLKGMSFRVLGGQAYWSAAGAKSPDYTESTRLEVAGTFPLTAGEGGKWGGRFPLRSEGLWRVELKNERGDANVAMKPGRYTATPDEAPQVSVSKPGSELVISAPQKVPVVVEAFDGLGLREIGLRVQRGDESERFSAEKCPAKTYPTVRRYEDYKPADSAVLMLDLTDLGVKVGETVRYKAVAVDRLGQTAESKPFTIRIAADPNAADKQLEAFEKSQDPFRDKLVKLIADQAKVKEETNKLAAKYAELTEKIEAAKLEEMKNAPKPAANADPAKTAELEKKLPKIDEKTAKELDDLRKELGKLLAEEQKNVALGEQMKADLNNLADAAQKNALLPPDVAAELNALKDKFDKVALNPLKDLADKFNQGANQKDTKPDVKGAKAESERVQKELEALLEKINAVKDVTKDVREGKDDALDKFRKEMEREKADLTARELEDLKNAIEALKGELERMKGAQSDLKDETEKSSDADLPKAANKQDNLDELIKKALENAKNALESDAKKNKRKKDRDRPDAPYSPEDEEKVPGKEADTNNPLPKDPADKKDPKDGTNPDGKDPKKDDMPPEDDDTFDGVVGKKEKKDPRFDDPRKKPKPKDGEPGDKKPMNDADKQRGDLNDRADKNLDNLDKASKGLESDKDAVQDLLDKLKAAAKSKGSKGEPKDGEPGESDPLADALKQMMQSPEMKAAMEMAARMKQGKGQAKGKPDNGPRQPGSNPNPSDRAGNPPPADTTAILGKLDLDTRTVILQMQPKLREEVLQGMQGLPPEGYRRHVEDYFKRLTDVQKGGK